MKDKAAEKIYLNGITPVIVLDSSEHAVPLASALMRSGIRVAEITYRTAAARDSIKEIRRALPDMLVGAGTITSIDMAKDAINAGAQFIISPGLDAELVEYCSREKILVIPGVATPSEAQQAVKLGLTLVKVYPAEILGGTAFIKALSAVYNTLRFMPTGGINADNLMEYLDVPSVASCGGSWLCPLKLIEEGKFDEIEQIAKAAVLKMHDFKLLHVGMNSCNQEEAREKAEALSEMFELPMIDSSASYFAGTMFEILKNPLYGERGHIAVETNYIGRAIAYFENRGYTFRDKPKDDLKKLIAIYFQEEIGGFAIHLRSRS